MSTQNSSTYTGHETFACRSYWLKKGYDFLKDKNNFSAPESPSILGVGKNMVRSIKYWLRAFALYEEDELTPLATKIFDNENGWDPYLEDINTIWLLHYFLVKKSYAKIYSDFFNEFKKRQTEFSFENFEYFLKNRTLNIAANSLESDVSVLKSNYLRSNRSGNEVDDTFSLFLQELNLIDQISVGTFHFNTRKKKALSNKIFFFTILDNFKDQTSISFDSLMSEYSCPGNIFCLTQEELFSRISMLTNEEEGVVFTEDAGVRELQISKDNFSNTYKVLEDYYDRK